MRQSHKVSQLNITQQNINNEREIFSNIKQCCYNKLYPGCNRHVVHQLAFAIALPDKRSVHTSKFENKWHTFIAATIGSGKQPIAIDNAKIFHNINRKVRAL